MTFAYVELALRIFFLAALLAVATGLGYMWGNSRPIQGCADALAEVVSGVCAPKQTLVVESGTAICRCPKE